MFFLFYFSGSQKDFTCGRVWAAKNFKKQGQLDETGLEVASCHHSIGQKALDMFQGELYGYPLYVINHIASNQNVKFYFADVMRKLWKFVKRYAPSIAKEIIPALSVINAKGDSLDFQVRSDMLVFFIY